MTHYIIVRCNRCGRFSIRKLTKTISCGYCNHRQLTKRKNEFGLNRVHYIFDNYLEAHEKYLQLTSLHI